MTDLKKDKKMIPNIRFKGFTEDWEQRKLGELFSERSERSADGELIAVTTKNGVKKANELSRKDNSSSDKSNYKIVEQGDIAYNTMRMWQGASGYSPYKGILSPAYTVIKPLDQTYSLFFAYLFKLVPVIQEFQRNSQGLTSDTFNLKYPAFSKIIISTPSMMEQKELASFLNSIDQLLTLHQRKLKGLEELKKLLLQKMFPQNGQNRPDIRFDGFTDDWEQRKLKDVSEFRKGYGYSKSDLSLNGKPIILYGRLYTKYETLIDDVDTFTDVENKNILSTGHEVIVPASGETSEDIARASAVSQPGVILGGDLNVLNPHSDINSSYLALGLSNGKQQKELAKKAQGKSVVHLHTGDLEQLTMLFPGLAEQTKIATVILRTEKLITLHQRKLQKLNDVKQLLLQNMFV